LKLPDPAIAFAQQIELPFFIDTQAQAGADFTPIGVRKTELFAQTDGFSRPGDAQLRNRCVSSRD
jgi:hypothetical protein